MLVVALLLIALATLFPFEFQPRSHGAGLDQILQRFEPGFTAPFWTPERLANVLLFAPFGFAVGTLAGRRGPAMLQTLALTAGAGLALSIAIEVIQVWYPSRVPSLRDVTANALGALLGSVGWWLAGDPIRRRLDSAYAKLVPAVSSLASFPGFAAYVLLVLLLAAGVLARDSLANWDTRYPLVLGNEATGDRPWRGRISELVIASRAADEDEVARLFAGGAVSDIFGDRLVASYAFVVDGVSSERPATLPSLLWQGTPGGEEHAQAGVPLGPDSWLTTQTGVTSLVERLRESSQFTLITTVATAGLDQFGPARIVSISRDPIHRNLTVGQNGSDLMLRLRTIRTGDNGAKPVIVVPDVFVDRAPRRLVVAYDSAVVSIWVDAPDRRYSIALAPELTLFHSLLGRRWWYLRFGTPSPAFYAAFYLGCVFLPAGWLLGLAVGRTPGSERLKVWLVGSAILLPPILLEAIWASARGIRPWRALLGAAFMGIATLSHRVWKRRASLH